MKKYIGIFTLIFLFVITFFSGDIARTLYDTFQKEICIDKGKICINKPKGYIPTLVKDNNVTYFFNLINEKYIFRHDGEYGNLKDIDNSIFLLAKDRKQFISIEKLSNTFLKNFEKFYDKNKEYIYRGDDMTEIIIPYKKVIVRMRFFDKNIYNSLKIGSKHLILIKKLRWK